MCAGASVGEHGRWRASPRRDFLDSLGAVGRDVAVERNGIRLTYFLDLVKNRTYSIVQLNVIVYTSIVELFNTGVQMWRHLISAYPTR